MCRYGNAYKAHEHLVNAKYKILKTTDYRGIITYVYYICGFDSSSPLLFWGKNYMRANTNLFN